MEKPIRLRNEGPPKVGDRILIPCKLCEEYVEVLIDKQRDRVLSGALRCECGFGCTIDIQWYSIEEIKKGVEKYASRVQRYLSN